MRVFKPNFGGELGSPFFILSFLGLRQSQSVVVLSKLCKISFPTGKDLQNASVALPVGDVSVIMTYFALCISFVDKTWTPNKTNSVCSHGSRPAHSHIWRNMALTETESIITISVLIKAGIVSF